MFATDNNGVVLQLPAIADAGATSVSGSLIFGIGTQANNALSAPVIAVPDSGPTAGAFQAVYRGTTLTDSFIDSGSSGLYFNDASIAHVPEHRRRGRPLGVLLPRAGHGAVVGAGRRHDHGQQRRLGSADADRGQRTLSCSRSPARRALGAFDDLGGPSRDRRCRTPSTSACRSSSAGVSSRHSSSGPRRQEAVLTSRTRRPERRPEALGAPVRQPSATARGERDRQGALRLRAEAPFDVTCNTAGPPRNEASEVDREHGLLCIESDAPIRTRHAFALLFALVQDPVCAPPA